MKTSQQKHDSAADEQAALWAARLDGDHLDSAQRAELDAWLAEKPAHRVLLSQYCQFSADLEEKLPALVVAGAVTMPTGVKSAARRRGWSFPQLAAVTLAAAAAVVVTVAVLRPAPEVQNFAMASAERGARTLADGTRVELNANTSLRFVNSKTERRVFLAGGEALFMVAKDSTRPFYVETPTGLVRVTGTTFNVRTDPSATVFEVTVVEGAVQVHPSQLADSAPVPLGAGGQFSTVGSATTTRTLSENDFSDALAWREGRIVFRATPLSEALARYARHHGRNIRATPDVANELIGGSYSIDDLSDFLTGLELTLPVKVTRETSGAISVGLRR